MEEIQATGIQIRKMSCTITTFFPCSEMAQLRVFLSMNSNDIKQVHSGEYPSFCKAYSEEPQFGSMGCGSI